MNFYSPFPDIGSLPSLHRRRFSRVELTRFTSRENSTRTLVFSTIQAFSFTVVLRVVMMKTRIYLKCLLGLFYLQIFEEERKRVAEKQAKLSGK